MARKELKVIAIIVTYENGQRIERNWDDIPEPERAVISRTLTDRFMEAAGYSRLEKEAVAGIFSVLTSVATDLPEL